MAKRQVIEVTDDIDGKMLVDYETVQFAIGGRAYEFDTSAKHAEEFRKRMQRYVDVARPVTRTAGRTSVARVQSREQVNKVRVWAKDHGYQLSERGPIPASIQQAFDAVHRG